MGYQLYRLALMAWVFVRHTGVPGAVGVAAFIAGTLFTTNIVAGAVFGVAAGVLTHVLTTSRAAT